MPPAQGLFGLSRPQTTRASRFLMIYNGVTGVFGLLFVFLSFYARSQVPTQGWAEVVGEGLSMVGVIAGLLTVFMSLMGCVAAALQSRPALCCYLVIFVIAWCVQVAAAGAIMAYSQQLSLKNPNTPSSQLTAYDDIQIQNAAFSVYQRCCTGCPNKVCNNPSYDSYVNKTLPLCAGKTACQLVVPCSATVTAKCFRYLPGDPLVVPPYSPDRSVCNILGYLSTTNPSGKTVYLVDYADNGGCGGGDPTVFLKNLDTYLSTHLTGVFVVFILIICTESIALPTGIYLIFSRARREQPVEAEGFGEDAVIGMGEAGSKQVSTV